MHLGILSVETHVLDSGLGLHMYKHSTTMFNLIVHSLHATDSICLWYGNETKICEQLYSRCLVNTLWDLGRANAIDQICRLLQASSTSSIPQGGSAVREKVRLTVEGRVRDVLEKSNEVEL